MTASTQSIREHVSLFSSPARLRAPAFRVIDRMDGRVAPAEQVLGTAVALVAMAQAIGIDTRSLIQRAENVMRDVDSCDAEHVKAIRDYARNELARHHR